jgi:membrane fusion protein (multidrug efflux system)
VNTSTGTSDARAEVPNPAGEIRPGQFVRAILRGAQRPDAITVPQRALVESPQGKMVYIYAPGKNPNEFIAQPRPVKVGDWSGADWVITEGLQPGDKVIVDGLARIFFPGAPVVMGDPNAPQGPPGAPGKGGPPAKDAKGDAKKGGH